MDLKIDGLFTALLVFGGLIATALYGSIWLVSSLVSEPGDTYKVTEKVEPTIEIVIKENKVDTLYVYKFE